jgi:hypothetical protein
VIFIDMTQFRGSRADAQATVRRLVLPFAQPAEDDGSHSHTYSVVLVGNDTGHGHTIHEFEAICPENDAAANVRATVAGIREAADLFEAGYADVLADGEPADVPAHILVDLLGLAEVKVTEAEVMSWSKGQRRQAEHWASATHLRASDNDVPVPDQPDFVAVGDFRVGDLVRSRNSGQVVMVTGGGVWLKSFYELVTPREYGGSRGKQPAPEHTCAGEGCAHPVHRADMTPTEE